MKRFLLLALVMFTTIALHAEIKILDLKSGRYYYSEQIPEMTRTVTKYVDKIIISYTLNRIGVTNDDNKPYSYITIAGFGVETNEGLPATPYYFDEFDISGLSDVSVEYAASMKIEHPLQLGPAIEPNPDSRTVEIKEITPYSGKIPQNVLDGITDGCELGHRVLSYKIQPISYDYEKKYINNIS